MHTSDLFFLFNGTKCVHPIYPSMDHSLVICSSGPYPGVPSSFAPFNTSEQALSTEATGYWTSFSRSFDPSAHPPAGELTPSPLWPTSISGRLLIQEGKGETHIEAFSWEYEARCLFWNEVGPEIHL